MKIISFLTFLIFLSARGDRDLKYLKNFDQVKDIKEKNFSVLWEIPVNNANNNHFTRYNYNSERISLKKYRSNPENTVLVLYFESGKLYGSASISDEDYHLMGESQGYWLGLVPIDISYNYLKSFSETTEKKEVVYPLLISHHKDLETINYLTKNYDSNDYEGKKSILFWLGQVHNLKAVEFLMSKYQSEDNYDLKEKVIFSLYCNKTDLASRELLRIAKLGPERNLRKKAIFWIGQRAAKHMEHFFKDIIYTDEDFEIKKAAIFALYNMKDSKSLKEVASYSKDYRLRKKALFWMSQLEDIDITFFEDILNRN